MQAKAFHRAMGKVVRQHRLKRGLSQSDVAKPLRVSYQQVSKGEAGTNAFSSYQLAVIAELLRLNIGTLYAQATRKGKRA